MSSEFKLSSRSKFQVGVLMAIFGSFMAFGMLYQASSQGDFADTYPKGFRGGACTVETNSLTIGYSGYYLPDDYESPGNTSCLSSAAKSPSLAPSTFQLICYIQNRRAILRLRYV